MFNAIRKTIATFIAPKTVTVDATQQQLAAARSVTYTTLPQQHHLMTQADRAYVAGRVTGKFSVSDLDLLSSAYLRDSIANYAAWCALAMAFSAYERMAGKKNADATAFGKLVDEFHCWNAALPEGKQMDEEAILLAAEKLCQPRPDRSSDATDAIIARVRKITVAEVKADREAKAKAAAEKRRNLLDGFLAEVWGFTSSDMNPSISGAKAEAKAISTIEFVATSWQGDGASIAAELLLMEDDIKKLRHIAHQETLREGEGYEQQ